MNRYEQMKDIFYQTIEDKCFGIYKQKAYFHSIQVCTLCQIYAKERNLDIELASIIGLFHDYSQFINHSSFNHAAISSEMTAKILNDYSFTDEEKHIIVTAIRLHSDKHRIDDDYSELIKDADVMAKYYEDPQCIFKDTENKRIQNLLFKRV